MARHILSRRTVLRGAGGLALALPWMESLAPRTARAQTASAMRFIPIYFPCGVGDYWKPARAGQGGGWQLSSVLAPLAAVKDKVAVLGNVDNTAPFAGGAAPGHALLTGAFLTCARATGTGASVRNGVSIDQVVAQGIGALPFPSLQLGLATTASPTEGLAPALSRSISWGAGGQPLPKMVDPQAVFDRLVGAPPAPTTGTFAARRAADKNILDFVRGDALEVAGRLSKGDQHRLDAFLTSIVDLEKRLGPAPAVPQCPTVTRPAQRIDVGNVPADYSRDRHADLMVDLMVMALQCQRTRVISLMLDDARSDYVYDFLPEGSFRAPTTPPRGVNVSAGLHDLASGDPARSSDSWATVTHWMVSKVARLARAMAAIPDSPNSSLLDSSVIWMGSETHGQDHSARDLPLLYVGSAGGRLKVNQYINFATSQRLADVYLTLLRHGFGSTVPSFAGSTSVVPALIA